ncbi:MAG: pyrroline-5-carboxylate reductase [Magnetospiraceae bacterium]
MTSPTLLLVGGGKMGGALIGGWLETGIAAKCVTVVEPNTDIHAYLQSDLGVQAIADPEELEAGYLPDVILLAVKPQMMDKVAPLYARFTGGKTVFLSIAAGTPIARFQDWLGAAAPIVRAMPNTPAAIRQGMTVLCPGPGVSEAQRDLCQSLLSAVGAVEWLDGEGLMDAVTAVSGSGPAYVFWLAECLAKAGVDAGLPEDLAQKLASETVTGAGALMAQSPEPPATLRQNVTSPGGTTAAALAVLMAENGLAPLMMRAVAAATKRGKELAG